MVVKYSSSSSSSAALVAVLISCLLATAAVMAIDHYDENVLYAGQRLRVNESLRWGTYKLIMQADCNLCLYNNGKWMWCSSTNGHGNDCSLFMQKDGNLVVYNNGYASSLWVISHTSLPRGDDYVLLLRQDGILAVYSKRLWSAIRYGAPTVLQMPSLYVNNNNVHALPPANPRYDQNVLYEGERLTVNQELCVKSYRLIMQANCNLVLYSASGAVSVWDSRTTGMGTGCYLQLHKDGNLAIYDNGNKALWQTSTTANGSGDYVLILQNNGNVVLYSKALWSNKPIPDLNSTIHVNSNTTTITH